MNAFVICYHDASTQAKANALANALGVESMPYTEAVQLPYDYLLSYQAGTLWLHCLKASDLKPFCVDFCHGRLGYRLKQNNRQQPLARAVGIKASYLPKILDITAGFGQDASVLASLGCPMQLVERHPIVFALLQDGLVRAGLEKAWAKQVMLTHQSAMAYCQALVGQHQAQLPDVIYCDPMFEQAGRQGRQAKVKKPMQLLQQLVGEDDNAAQLLTLVRDIAQRRVVIKRIKNAAPWCGQTPDAVIPMVGYRFDVFFSKR